MLKDLQLKNQYTTGYDEPKVFFTEALIESKTFDLGLGFFSSSGIRSLAYGFAIFIARGGKARIVINHILSEQDKKAIENGQNCSFPEFEDKLIADIEYLTQTFSKSDEQFFKCLSYLISVKRLEFVATISTKGGLGHDKYGIFTDEEGEKIAFVGSANFSQSALELNGETITVFKNSDKERIEEYENIFNDAWSNDSTHLVHIPIEKVTTYIEKKFETKSIDDLISNGISLRELEGDIEIITSKPLPNSLIKKIEQIEQEPRFPFPEERTIQKDAYAAWKANNNNGIFAMATGSGKTVTALNCVLHEFKEKGYYKVIIVVPTQALAKQWEDEVKAFNYSNIISTHTEKDWKNILQRYTTRSLFDTKKNIVVITTYATFIRGNLQNFIEKTKGIEDFIFIADEVHNIGANGPMKHLPTKIHNRIGLSATPERIYDEGGSNKLYEFFETEPPRYTYRFTMKDAIENGILCHYMYYPLFVSLTEDEMEQYILKTNQLRKYIDPRTGKYKKDAEMLLMARKRIVHKAARKKTALIQLLNERNSKSDLKYTFVFVPEGYEPDYAEIDEYNIDKEDIHIIDEYSQMFKEQKYSYHQFISGLEDSQSILDSFEKGKIDILLSMKCLDEGVDIPRAQNAIFISSTGNPRQFIQRRGRVLRKHKDKEMAYIWDMIVIPPGIEEASSTEKNLFANEVKRVLNFAALADNKIDILYGDLKELCFNLQIDMFNMLEEEENKYN